MNFSRSERFRYRTPQEPNLRPPSSLTDGQMQAIMNAARTLPPGKRSELLQRIAARLRLVENAKARNLVVEFGNERASRLMAVMGRVFSSPPRERCENLDSDETPSQPSSGMQERIGHTYTVEFQP